MDTIARVKELSEERNISLYKLAQICDLPYSTLKNTAARNGQLSVDTIEQICIGLGMPLAAFFEESQRGCGNG